MKKLIIGISTCYVLLMITLVVIIFQNRKLQNTMETMRYDIEFIDNNLNDCSDKYLGRVMKDETGKIMGARPNNSEENESHEEGME